MAVLTSILLGALQVNTSEKAWLLCNNHNVRSSEWPTFGAPYWLMQTRYRYVAHDALYFEFVCLVLGKICISLSCCTTCEMMNVRCRPSLIFLMRAHHNQIGRAHV